MPNQFDPNVDPQITQLTRSMPSWMNPYGYANSYAGKYNDAPNQNSAPDAFNFAAIQNPTPAPPAQPSQAGNAAAVMGGQNINGGSEAGAGGGSAEQQSVDAVQNGFDAGTSNQNLGPNPGNLADLFGGVSGLGPAIGGALGGLAGTALGGPIGGLVGGFGGKLLGGLFGSSDASKGGPSVGDLSSADLSPSGPGGMGGYGVATDPTTGAAVNVGTDFSNPGGGGGGGGGAGPDIGAAGDVTAEARGSAKGGIITRNKLTGPDPDGPDDGYGKLKLGEGVLTDKALKHYGKGIVARLNKLQVPMERLRA